MEISADVENFVSCLVSADTSFVPPCPLKSAKASQLQDFLATKALALVGAGVHTEDPASNCCSLVPFSQVPFWYTCLSHSHLETSQMRGH